MVYKILLADLEGGDDVVAKLIEGSVAMGDRVLEVLVHLSVGLRLVLSVLGLILKAGLEDGIPAEKMSRASAGSHDASMSSSFENDGLDVLGGGEGENALSVGSAIVKTVQHLVQANVTTALKEPLANNDEETKGLVSNLKQRERGHRSAMVKQEREYEHVRSREPSQSVEAERSIFDHDGSIDLEFKTGVRMSGAQLEEWDTIVSELRKEWVCGNVLEQRRACTSR